MNNFPRIALLSFHTSPLATLGGSVSGGMNVYIREISKRLIDKGFQVDIFTRREEQELPSIMDLGDGLRLFNIDAGPTTTVNKNDLSLWISSFTANVKKTIENFDYDYELIFSHYWLSMLAGEILAHDWDVPHIGMFHTLAEVKLEALASENETQERLEAERRLIGKLDRIVAATSDEKEIMRIIYGVPANNINVVPLGVGPDFFEERSQNQAREKLNFFDEDKIVLAVGRVEPLKGLDVLVRAIQHIDEEMSCQLVIIGGDEAASAEIIRLKDIAKQVGIAHKVKFIGSVDHSKLPIYYRAADVVAIPSFSESFGLVAVEAMASGVPVVASNVGGLALTVEHGRAGFLIPPGCSDQFGEKINLLLRDPKLRNEFGRVGVENMKSYSWDAVALQLCNIFQSLLEDSSKISITSEVAGA
ncbi:MAG: glycosyltransferase [Dehalococcoidia bacterium]